MYTSWRSRAVRRQWGVESGAERRARLHVARLYFAKPGQDGLCLSERAREQAELARIGEYLGKHLGLERARQARREGVAQQPHVVLRVVVARAGRAVHGS